MKTPLTNLIALLTWVLLLAGQTYAQSDLNGSVFYHLKNNRPISTAVITLINAENQIVDVTTTETNGSFGFTNVAYGSYLIEASTTQMPGGINMADAQKVRHHLMGNQTLNEIEQLAADVDNDNEITWNDYDAIVAWFMEGTPFQTEPWVFQIISFENTGTKTNVPTMGGSSAGDVNGTFVPATRNANAVDATYTTKYAENNFSVEIVAQDISEAAAMGLAINYPYSEIDITKVTSPLGEIGLSVKNGQIRVSWVSPSSGSVSVDPNSPILVIEATTNSTYTGSEIKFVIDPVSNFSNYKGDEIDTRYTLPLIIKSGNHLCLNYPNPFSASTNITYSLPVDAKVNISLFNQQGQMVRVIKDAVENAGTYNIVFESNGLEAGVYYYTLKTSGANAINETKRMIITR
jgi:hypothetical protein